MCSQLEPETELTVYPDLFGVEAPEGLDLIPKRTYNGYLLPMVYVDHKGKPDEARKARLARFGMIPPWLEEADARKFNGTTFNAKSEEVLSKGTYKPAIRAARFCIVPAKTIIEPYYETPTAKNVWTRIRRQDGKPLNVGAIWSTWWKPGAESGITGVSLLTLDCADNPLLNRFHKHGDPRRSVVMIDDDDIEPWLMATQDSMASFFKPHPADLLETEPAPVIVRKKSERPEAPADLL